MLAVALALLLTGETGTHAATRDALVQGSTHLAGRGQRSNANFGYSVAVPSNGGIVLVGGPGDSSGTGTAWVLTHASNWWSQRAPKLLPANASASAGFGSSVALSSNGSIALIGGPGDSSGTGAAWAFARRGSTWTRRGSTISGRGASANARFGSSVALSPDGRTALIGGPDERGGGAAWAFTRPGSTWKQQGSKLTGKGAKNGDHFGQSVTLASHGRTALIGGPSDRGGGAAWLFMHSGSAWNQQGSELTPGDGGHSFGFSVTLASDSSAAVIGGPYDNATKGDAWALQLSPLAPTPSCLGAAARDPQHPCNNPNLRLTVRPSPSEAPLTPSAPCSLVGGDGLINSCAFGVPAATSTATVALIGDSHAIHWRAALEVVAQAKAWEALSAVRSGCPFTAAGSTIPEPLRSLCNERNREVPSWLAQHPEVSTVFVGEHSAGDVTVRGGQETFEAQEAGYVRAWNSLPPSVRHVVVIRDNPQFRPDVLECVQQAIARRQPAGVLCAEPRQVALGEDPAAAAARRLHSHRVQVVDLTPFFCDSSLCYPVVGGVLVYRDPNHLTEAFATSLGPYLLREVDRLAASWRSPAKRQPRLP